MDRYGARGVMLASIVLVVASCLATVALISLPGLMIFYGVGVGVGSGALSVVMGAAIANRWFVKRRGLVTGLLGAGFSAGQLVFVQLTTALTVTIDWRAALAPVQEQGSGARGVDDAEDVQERRLAAAGGAAHADVFAGGDGEAEVVDRDDRTRRHGEDARHAAGLDDRRRHVTTSWRSVAAIGSRPTSCMG